MARAALLLFLLALPAAAQEITRADLGTAYLRVDRAYRDHRPDDAAAIHRRFDQATMLFFRGALVQAIRDLDSVTADLRPDGARPPALRIWPEPRVARPGGTRIRVKALYPDERRWELVLRAGDRALWRAAAEDGAELEPPSLPPGAYDLELQAESGPAWPATRFFVSAMPMSAWRERNEARLDAAQGPAAAIANARARNRLVRDEGSFSETTLILLDPLDLARRVRAEVERIATAGEDPYRNLPGDHWAVAARGGQEVPMRVFAPPANGRDVRMPLVVALHGAGGDENLWFEGYGAGMLRDLAARHRFVAICPSTYKLMAGAPVFDLVLQWARDHYPIDEGRIYLVGHSLGAMVSGQLAVQRREALAGVVCLAGGAVGGECAPTLIVGGGLDPLVPAARLRRAFDAASEQDFDVTYREEPHCGHTLMVGDLLPDCIDWLLRRGQ